ncbi:MAG TPA: DNA transposition protein, partial [Desulfovibrio sp.]|nr:DNA transposition protein [Desulfovibrio sp.]
TPLGVYYGFPGYGKTISLTFAANRHSALYLEIGASWTVKKFCQTLLRELGVKPTKTVADMVEQIIETMSMETRPIIIDEFDHITNMGEKSVNIIREILDKARCPIVLIGEEGLPGRLKRWPRFDSRVRSWVAAQPCTVDDAQKLAQLYASEIRIDEAVLADMTAQASGVTRRVCHGIETVREMAAVKGLTKVDLKDVADLPYWQSRPTARRA